MLRRLCHIEIGTLRCIPSLTHNLTNKRRYTDQKGEEDIHILRRKLKWRAMERGMLENEIILRRFIDENLENLPREELNVFSDILDIYDPNLNAWYDYYWCAQSSRFTGREEPPEDLKNEALFQRIMQYTNVHHDKVNN